MQLKAFKNDAYIAAETRDDRYRVGIRSEITLSYDCDRFYLIDQDKSNFSAQVRLDEGDTIFLSAGMYSKGETMELSFEEFTRALYDLIVKKKLEAEKLKQKGKK